MTTAQAVNYVLVREGLSKYRLAKILGCAPVSVNQWLRGTKMSDFYKHSMFNTFGVKIDDSL